MLLNITDYAIMAIFQLTQCSLSYATYTQQLNDFLRRFRQHFTDDFQRAYFVKGLPSFQLHTHANYHRSQHKG
jgi:ABC-type uncharacterized transport system fused permease/ATPase subunit